MSDTKHHPAPRCTPSHHDETRGTPSSPAPIRQIPRGVSGEDLVHESRRALRRGMVWLRGCQRVRIREVTPRVVTVMELDHGRAAHRRIPLDYFLRTSRPASL
jgi:hypothetical protein